MLRFEDSVIRPWVLTTPTLHNHYEKFKEQVKSEGIADPYTKITMLRVYYQVILKTGYYRTIYANMLKEHDYVLDPDLVETITSLLYKYGWQRFFIALRVVITNLKNQVKVGSVNERRYETSLEQLEKVPNTTELPTMRK